jgi:hypothetical protein
VPLSDFGLSVVDKAKKAASPSCISGQISSAPLPNAPRWRSLHASAPDQHAPEIPRWVPPAVRGVLQLEKLIDGMPDFAIMRRLATDPRMRYVWRELKRQGAGDNALRLFILTAYNGARRPFRVVTLEQRTEAANLCTTIATDCRDAIRHDARVRDDPELAAALARTAAYYERLIHENPPGANYLVKHRTKNDQSRVYVRALCDLMKKLFGNRLDGSTATTASIALNQKITRRQVRNWCAE